MMRISRKRNMKAESHSYVDIKSQSILADPLQTQNQTFKLKTESDDSCSFLEEIDSVDLTNHFTKSITNKQNKTMNQAVINFSVEELQNIMYESDDGDWKFYTKFSPKDKHKNMVPYKKLMQEKITKALNIEKVVSKESFKKTAISRLGYFECEHGSTIAIKCPLASFRGDQDLSFDVTFDCHLCNQSGDEGLQLERKLVGKKGQEQPKKMNSHSSSSRDYDEPVQSKSKPDSATRNFAEYLIGECRDLIMSALEKITEKHLPDQQLKEFIAEAPFTALAINNTIVEEAKHLQIRTQRQGSRSQPRRSEVNGDVDGGPSKKRCIQKTDYRERVFSENYKYSEKFSGRYKKRYLKSS